MTQRGNPKQERRRHPRALTDLQATVTVDGASHAAKVINLSMGGALLDLEAAPLGPTVEVGLPLTLEIRRASRRGTFRADARAVLWTRTDGQAPLLAIQFEPMGDEPSELLEELMFEALSQLHGRALAASSSNSPTIRNAAGFPKITS